MPRKFQRTIEVPDAAERKQIRTDAGFTQAQVANAIGVSPSTIAKWEQGTTPRGLQRIAYAKALEKIRADSEES